MSNNKIKLFSQHDLSKIVKVDKTTLYGEPYMVTEITSRRGGITRNFYDEMVVNTCRSATTVTAIQKTAVTVFTANTPTIIFTILKEI